MKLSSLFTDHAVLQQGVSIPVWGWTRPNEMVVCRLGHVEARTCSASDGKFLLRFPAQNAGGPFTLEAFLAASPDADRAVAKNVYVGEVWLASGQSNMQWELFQTGSQGQATLNDCEIPTLRMINIPRNAKLGKEVNPKAAWKVSGKEASRDFSAVGFHFANRLRKELGVAVGIINASWGGSIAEAWCSRNALLRNPDKRDWLLNYEKEVYSPEFWADLNKGPNTRLEKLLAKMLPPDKGNLGLKDGWARPEFNDADWRSMDLPGSWISNGDARNGVVWFRLTLNLPEAWAGRDLKVSIGRVDKHDITYFNGEEIGRTGAGHDLSVWDKQRVYTIPGRLVRAGRNVLAVRATSFIYDGGMIGPEDIMRIRPAAGEGEAISVAGAWQYCFEQDFGLIGDVTLPPGPGVANSPHMLYDNMIHPLLPYAIRGAIWYQGESNASSHRKYRRVMSEMLSDWRSAFEQGDFPFLIVQLANYGNPKEHQRGSLWAHLREAQVQILEERETGMAVAIDVGEAENIHPTDKLTVGNRLAAWALARTYGRGIVYSGPLFKSASVEGRHIRIHFDHVGSGLTSQDGSLKTFFIADESRAFVEAEAVIEGDTVLVSHPTVACPKAARYAWANNPVGCNLYNAEGFPASPFRTDDW